MMKTLTHESHKPIMEKTFHESTFGGYLDTTWRIIPVSG